MPTQKVIKKINAYPITAQLKSAETTLSVQILKVTEKGFLAEAPKVTAFLQPGEKFDCSFELPVLHHSLSEPVMIIKLYSQLGAQAEPAAQTANAAALTGMIEAHFLALSITGREHVVSFLKALAKTKK